MRGSSGTPPKCNKQTSWTCQMALLLVGKKDDEFLFEVLQVLCPSGGDLLSIGQVGLSNRDEGGVEGSNGGGLGLSHGWLVSQESGDWGSGVVGEVVGSSSGHGGLVQGDDGSVREGSQTPGAGTVGGGGVASWGVASVASSGPSGCGPLGAGRGGAGS